MVKTFVNIDTSTCQVRKSVNAEALGVSLLEATLRVRTAVQVLAWMTAIVADVRFRAEATLERVANGVAWAVTALLAGYNSDAAYTRIGISDCSLRANASEGTLRILTECILTARIWSCAFIDIEALLLGIAGKAWWT